MPIQWKDDDFELFFGQAPVREQVDALPGDSYLIVYEGERLKYELYLYPEHEVVMISGDYEHPFGADSLFEITIPCDSVSRCGDGYHPEQSGLQFWYGDVTQHHNGTMQLLKRPNGDLKVWPACVWPAGHKFFVGDP